MTILDPNVRAALDAHGMAGEEVACDPELADTAQFCGHYGIPPAHACNTIIVALKTNPRQYVACLVTAESRLDVNHKVSAIVGVKRMSFASAEETKELTGQMIGGVTVLALPDGMPLLIDQRVMEREWVIVGGGNRSSKVRLDPRELLKIPGARVAEIS